MKAKTQVPCACGPSHAPSSQFLRRWGVSRPSSSLAHDTAQHNAETKPSAESAAGNPLSFVFLVFSGLHGFIGRVDFFSSFVSLKNTRRKYVIGLMRTDPPLCTTSAGPGAATHAAAGVTPTAIGLGTSRRHSADGWGGARGWARVEGKEGGNERREAATAMARADLARPQNLA